MLTHVKYLNNSSVMLGFLFSHKCLKDLNVGVLPSQDILIPNVV